MKISGFSYIRNGFKYGYPFLQSIQSILPICDEFIMAVGNSEDGTREAILNLGNPKIKIIDTVWDETLRINGKIFAQQANIALKEVTGDWAFHIQADEVMHENDLNKIYEDFVALKDDKRFDGLLFNFLNFFGSYNYLNNTRYTHKKEIRAFKTHLNVFSYRDSQGFRIYPSEKEYMNGFKGYKLKVKDTQIPVFHYSYVRNPQQMSLKSNYFQTFWQGNENTDKIKLHAEQEFDYYNIERVKLFTGTHPKLMKEIIEKANWNFDPGKLHKKLSLKDKIIYAIEDRVKHRFGEYKNYLIVKE